MSMQETLKQIPAALLNVMPDVYHYTAPGKEDRYLVWAEDMESDSLCGDNRKDVQVIQGTVDLYTKTEHDPAVDKVQKQFETAEIPYTLNSVQYEEETEFIHYEWVFEVEDG